MLEGVLKGGVVAKEEDSTEGVSILGMLEGVLKVELNNLVRKALGVSILGMLEGVLKEKTKPTRDIMRYGSFNPWYVGGGVKSFRHSAM